MKKRVIIRLFSFCAALALVALGYALQAQKRAERYRLQIENTYSHMLDGLDESMGNIAVLLQKAEYTTEPLQMSGMAAKLLSEAESAKIALSQLPAGDGELTVLNRFLSQVGNYAVTVSKNAIAGKMPGREEESAMAALKNTAKKISRAVSDSATMYNNPEAWSKEIERKLDSEIPADSFAGAAAKLEESLDDYPTLVYDGPYSDHILEKEPLMIRNAAVVTEETARKKAAAVAGCDEGDLSFFGNSNGKIPAYCFEGTDVNIAVSKRGGYAVYMRKSRTVGGNVLEYRQASEKAKRFLNDLGITSLTETYSFTDEGVCVINFAYLDGQTICYTDLIKVGVAMDNGEIMLFEASGYLTNHTERAFDPPALTAEEAMKKVSPRLTVRETALALIPTDGGREARCYEFVCQAEDGTELLVYIHAVTGAEQDILILLKGDGGTLTK